MAYGFEAFNASGNYLLTDTYVKPWFMGKATIATIVGPTEITFKEDTEQTSPIVRNFRAYQVAYSIPYFYGNQKKGFAAITMPHVQVFYSPFVGWTSGYNYVIDVLIPTSLTPDITMAPEVYLFCTEHINVYTGTGYGLQIFNNVPQCTYDSNTQAFRPLYAIKRPAKFPVIQSPFLGAQPTLEITYLESLNADYTFNNGFDLLTKPIYVLPQFSLPLFVKEQPTVTYSVSQTDPFWFYNFKLFYRRNTGNGIQSRSYFYETFYEGEGGAPQFTWSAWGNSEITVVISDGTRYATTPGNGQFPNATYDITVSPSSPAEGTPFTVTVTTTNVPNGSTFNYTLTGNSINPTDFRGVYTSGSLTIQNNSGSVTFRPVIDGVADTENATFELFDPGGQIIKAITITITNTPAPAAVYTLSRTPASGNINEGSSFTITLTTNYVVAGEIHNYTVTGCDNLDGTGLNSAGTFPATVGDYELATSSKTFNVAADGRSDGFKTFTLTLAHGSNPSISIGINDTSQGEGNGGQIDLTTTATTINEGQSFTASASYNLNFATPYDGRLVGLRVGSASTNITESDGTLLPAGFAALVNTFQGGELVSQSRSWTVTIANDLTTEGPETLVLELIDENNFIYDTQAITINDTSIAPAATVSLYSSSPAVDSGTGLIYLNETTTKTLSLTVTVTHNIDNVPIYWKTTGTGPFSNSDVDTELSGTIYTVVGSVQRTLPGIIIKTDYTTEITAESFVIGFYSDSAYNNLLYQAPTVSINDTSQTPTLSISNVSITPAPVSEGNTVTCVFTIQDSSVQNIYFKVVGGAGFTGGDVASYTPANNLITSATGAGEQRTITVTLSADQTTEGTEQFFIYFFTTATWNSGNPVDANKWGQIGPISVSDTSTTPAIRTFTRSVSQVNEGQSFSITFTTNQAGSFAYTITGVTQGDLGGAALTGTVTNNSVLNYTATSDVNTEGDETFVITLDSYPTVTTSVLIKDTSVTAAPTAETIAMNTLGKALNVSTGAYLFNNVYWVTWTLSSITEIVFSTEHELPIDTNGTDTTIAIYSSSGTLMHISGLGDDLGVDGRGVNYSSRITTTLGAGTYYGAIAVYSAGYQFLPNYATTGFAQFTLVDNAPNIRVSLWTGTPNPQVQGVSIPSSINEGDTAIFSFTLLDTLDRTIYHRLVLSNATSVDFTTAISASWNNLWPRSTNSLSITATADALTESSAESFYWQLSTTSDFSNVFYSSSSVTINDTSQTVVPAWSFGAPPGNLSEGVQYAIQFNASNWNGNTAYFSVQPPNNGGTAASATEFSAFTSSLAVNSNSYSGYVYMTVNQDYIAEGDEWFRILANNSSGTPLAVSDNIKVVAHSAPNYTITNLAGSMNEGTAYTGTFTAYNIRNTVFTLQVTAPSSGTAATSSEITISPSSITTSSDSDTSTHSFTVTPAADAANETNEYFRVGAYVGGSLATQTGDILIPGTASTPTGTFSVSPASHTGYANIAASWSISGSPTPVVNIEGSNGFAFNNAGVTASGYILEYNVGEDVTYTLTASNSGGTLTLTSSSLVPEVSVSLSASPSTITSGQSTTLSYTTTNATSAQISPGVGALSPLSSGSVTVSPTTTTTYTLGANNVQKVAQTTATVTVAAAAIDLFAVSVSPNPLTAVAGGTVPYTVTAYLNQATPVAVAIDITLSGSYLYDGTYTGLITIPAGASYGSWQNALGDEQGTRNVLVTASKSGYASSPSIWWSLQAAPAGASGTMTVTGSSMWNYSGGLTSASPLTGTSSNNNQQSTTAYINFIVQNGGGTVYYNISSSSELNYDFARIRKNGAVQAERSGAGQNMSGSFAVAAGNTVAVEYSKDGSLDIGSDNATINSLYFVAS